MSKKDPRVDAYIKKAEPFAQPILIHLRELVHKACPDIEETMKWSFPNFVYKGGTICSMASFKKHMAFTFWKAALMKDASLFELNAKSEVAMGHMGKITSLNELPADKKMIAYIKEAASLNEKGIKLPSKKRAIETKEIEAPTYLLAALKKNKKAKDTYEGFSYSNKKEYVTWLEEAKTETTRNKRLEEAIEWMAEGKIRHWKYLKK
ncbi:MAG: hypothetical protein K0S26_2092 [Bacteroidota bacterium]|jgi:uncharacterized protein YdeI (YjbR/CyaY-like superfamily)|nr:hypothetical protein [Bacteroidota bacterium]